MYLVYCSAFFWFKVYKKLFQMKSASLLFVFQEISEKVHTKVKHQSRKKIEYDFEFDNEYTDTTPIGNNYQAQIPSFVDAPPSKRHFQYDKIDALVWNPHRLDESDVVSHLDAVGVTGKRRRHQLNAYDEEMALFELHKCDYDVDEAQRRFERRLPTLLLEDVWSNEDKVTFQTELKKNGKDFTAIQKELFWKSSQEIIQYYYATKKL